MLRPSRDLTSLLKPTIATAADLARYVVLVTVFAIVLALSLDVVNQLIFFVSWTVAVRSWVVTVLIVVATAVPISFLIGRAQQDLHVAKHAIEVASRTDVLTGLPNRRALMELVDDEWLKVTALVIVDIDRFKAVNDTHGHRAGDAVIRAVGQSLAAALAEHGFVGRLGGEEFAALTSSAEIVALLRRLESFRARLADEPVVTDEAAITVSISAGAAIRGDGDSFDRLYAEADQALYRAKAAGRDSIALSPRLQAHCEEAGDPRRTAA